MTSIFCDENRADLHEILSQLQTGGVFLNKAPRETASPIGAQGSSTNSAASGTDLIHQLIRKQVCFYPGEE